MLSGSKTRRTLIICPELVVPNGSAETHCLYSSYYGRPTGSHGLTDFSDSIKPRLRAEERFQAARNSGYPFNPLSREAEQTLPSGAPEHAHKKFIGTGEQQMDKMASALTTSGEEWFVAKGHVHYDKGTKQSLFNGRSLMKDGSGWIDYPGTSSVRIDECHGIWFVVYGWKTNTSSTDDEST